MPNFVGSLNTNSVFASLYNQIISTQVFDNGISDLGGIYQSRKVDGTLNGDTKLYISTDVLKSYVFDHSGTAGYTLLTAKRPPAPVEQEIVIDTFRQIPVTVDEYLSKQAFAEEGAFAQFNSRIISWLQTTKEIYEYTTYTSNILTAARGAAKTLKTIDLTGPSATMLDRDLLQWRAQEMFRQLQDAIKELNEPSRDYNDVAFLRNYKLEDFDIVIPLGVLSSVDKHAIPYLFNEDSKPSIKEVNWKYFGTIDADGIAHVLGTERSLVEKDYVVGAVTTHCFPGDLIPHEAVAGNYDAYVPQFAAMPSLETDGVEILLIHKKDFPIMSAFSVGTSFFNAQNLTTQQYLTFGHNNLLNSHLGEYACLKVIVHVAAFGA